MPEEDIDIKNLCVQEFKAERRQGLLMLDIQIYILILFCIPYLIGLVLQINLFTWV